MINEGGIYYNRLTKYENFKANTKLYYDFNKHNIIYSI